MLDSVWGDTQEYIEDLLSDARNVLLSSEYTQYLSKLKLQNRTFLAASPCLGPYNSILGCWLTVPPSTGN